MRKKLIVEAIWLAGIFVVSYLLFEFVAGNSALDINMHDTYIVNNGISASLSLSCFLFSYFITIGFCVFFVRVVYFEFKLILAEIC
jgi:hypothetical protein